mmetsp:Transcript_102007/g.327290  ORF Transcript_102007/g.327290 Transcript_102007/m.327290 type:complete len:211 (-) Transcript_102007:967-1599(-)
MLSFAEMERRWHLTLHLQLCSVGDWQELWSRRSCSSTAFRDTPRLSIGQLAWFPERSIAHVASYLARLVQRLRCRLRRHLHHRRDALPFQPWRGIRTGTSWPRCPPNTQLQCMLWVTCSAAALPSTCIVTPVWALRLAWHGSPTTSKGRWQLDCQQGLPCGAIPSLGVGGALGLCMVSPSRALASRGRPMDGVLPLLGLAASFAFGHTAN